jgi:hypothetical protein
MTWKLIDLIAGQPTPVGSLGFHVQEHAKFFGRHVTLYNSHSRKEAVLFGNYVEFLGDPPAECQLQAKGNLEMEAVQKP